MGTLVRHRGYRELRTVVPERQPSFNRQRGWWGAGILRRRYYGGLLAEIRNGTEPERLVDDKVPPLLDTRTKGMQAFGLRTELYLERKQHGSICVQFL